MPNVNLKDSYPEVHILVQNLKGMGFNCDQVPFWAEKDEYIHLVDEILDFNALCTKIR